MQSLRCWLIAESLNISNDLVNSLVDDIDTEKKLFYGVTMKYESRLWEEEVQTVWQVKHASLWRTTCAEEGFGFPQSDKVEI